MPEFRYKPTEPHFKYLAHSGGTLPSTSAVSSGTQVSALSDAYGRLSIQGAAPINSSTAGLYPVFMGGYHQSTGSLVPLPVTDTGLKVDTELEVTGTLIANLYTFKDYSGSIQAALVDSNRRQEVILASGTCVAGTIDARCTQVTDPWTVSGTVTATPSGTQDVDIVAQSLSKLNVGISDTTSTVNAVGESVILQQSTPSDGYAFTNALETGAALSGFDGTDWDRLRTVKALSGGTMSSNIGILLTAPMGNTGGSFAAFPQEPTSPYEQKISLNKSNIQVPVDMQARYYTQTTLWSSTNTVDNGTATYADISIEYYLTKSVYVYCTQASTVLVDLSPSGTNTWYNYINENASANTLKLITFTDAAEYARVRVVTPTAGTLSAHFSKQV